MLQGLRDSRRGTNSTEISQKTITKKKRKATKRVPKFSCTKDDFKWELQGILLTPLLTSQIWGFVNSLFSRCDNFFKIHAMHMLVRYGAHDAC
jgi:hypothetical protein